MATPDFKNPLIRWIDRRLPIFSLLWHSSKGYPSPKTQNYLYVFGALMLVVFALLVVSGVILAMYYVPTAEGAFDSIDRIMRDVPFGWLIRMIHMNGASFFFLFVYIHLFRSIYYGSYKAPRELVWIIGVVIYLVMMAIGFMGYALPWGQMSYWATTVAVNLFSAVPFVGESLTTWIRGSFVVDTNTLHRLFSLHYLLGLGLAAFVLFHLWALHTVKSGDPDGIGMKTQEDSVPFDPYITAKDIFAVGIFLFFFAAVLFFIPGFFAEPTNSIPADPLNTPAHIMPEWFFLPFFTMLRAVPWKLLGVVLMFGSPAVLVALPFLDKSPVRSYRYRPLMKIFFWIFVADCIVLTWLGAQPTTGLYLWAGRLGTAWFFLHVFAAIPLVSRYEKTLPVPDSIAAVYAQRHERARKNRFKKEPRT